MNLDRDQLKADRDWLLMKTIVQFMRETDRADSVYEFCSRGSDMMKKLELEMHDAIRKGLWKPWRQQEKTI